MQSLFIVTLQNHTQCSETHGINAEQTFYYFFRLQIFSFVSSRKFIFNIFVAMWQMRCMTAENFLPLLSDPSNTISNRFQDSGTW